jgi:hypothetical protein
LFHAKIRWPGLVAAARGCASLPAIADNPIIQTNFTADSAPMGLGDTVYLFAAHDEDDANDFTMRDLLGHAGAPLRWKQDDDALVITAPQTMPYPTAVAFNIR